MEQLVSALQWMVRAAQRGMSNRFDTVRFGILDILHQQMPLPLGELAAELDVNPSSISRTIQALEKEGLVTVTANPNDGRSSFAALTDSGMHEWQRFHTAGLAVTAQVLQHWSDRDIEDLTRLLNRLVEDWERAPINDVSQKPASQTTKRKPRF
jgi:DNA-binding MarR family transcriptional regulator